MLIFINYRQIPCSALTWPVNETTDIAGLWELHKRGSPRSTRGEYVRKVWESKVKVKKYIFSMSSSLFLSLHRRAHCSMWATNSGVSVYSVRAAMSGWVDIIQPMKVNLISRARVPPRRNLFKFILHTRVSFNASQTVIVRWTPFVGRLSKLEEWKLLFDHILVLSWIRSSFSVICG